MAAQAQTMQRLKKDCMQRLDDMDHLLMDHGIRTAFWPVGLPPGPKT